MHHRMSARSCLAAAAVAAMTLGVVAAAPAQASAPPRHPLPGSAPKWLARAKHLGAASSSGAVKLRVYLAANGGEDALKAAVAAVSTPGSAAYRKFLSPAQYRASYEPTGTAVEQVSSWLTSQGLHISGVEASHRYLSVTGTVAAAEKAFGTTIQRYAHGGQTVQAPAGTISVPDNLASAVLGVTGLDTTQNLMKPAAIAPPPSFVNGRPCSIYYGQLQAKYQADFVTPLPKFNGKFQNYAVCGYTPIQLRAAYEGATELDGAGVTVAIVDAYQSPTLKKDANQYATNHGDPAFAASQFTAVPAAPYTNKTLCDASGWSSEQSLDVEAVHGMALGANVRYYAASSCLDQDLGDALNRVVDDNAASVVTDSWGEPEEGESAGSVAAYTQTFLQGAMQGISFQFSSGDNGDELANTGLLQADSPASNPYVTAVGGTSTAIGGDGSLTFQTGWGTAKYSLSSDGSSWALTVPFLYGAGGGFSALFNRPAYQNGVVPANSPPGRAVPDVAMDADPTTGMLIGETQTFPDGVHYGEYRIGGTSLASPLFAGMQALAQQHLGGRLGFANPTIYGQVTGNAGTFLDVKNVQQGNGDVRVNYANGNDPSGGLLYSVRTFDQDSSLTVKKGWDDVTGVGVPAPSFLTSLP